MTVMKRKWFLLSISVILILLGACEALENLGPDSIYDTWYCVETSVDFKETHYYVDLSKHPSEEGKIIIDNFYDLGYGLEVTANLAGLTITIPAQIVDGNSISGTGKISANYKTIDFTYNVDDGGGTIDHVTAVYSKN